MYTLANTDPGFFISLLEKGGLPALAIGMCFTIFMFWLKSQAKKDAAAQIIHAKQDERDSLRYSELMKAYEDMVSLLIELSKESTQAVTRLSERVAYCPYREPQTTPIAVNEEINDG